MKTSFVQSATVASALALAVVCSQSCERPSTSATPPTIPECNELTQGICREIVKLKPRFEALAAFDPSDRHINNQAPPALFPSIDYFYDSGYTGPLNKKGQRDPRANEDGCILRLNIYPDRQTLHDRAPQSGYYGWDRIKCDNGAIVVFWMDCPNPTLSAELTQTIRRKAETW
jgi:hypothetical protein